MKNYNETIYSSSHMISVDSSNLPLREITMLALLSETGCLNDVDTYNDIRDISVVWYVDKFEDIVVEQIYNQETGEVYWWDKPEEVWTDNDELLVNTLLMWGELESTLDGCC